jgi:hypothetical protein
MAEEPVAAKREDKGDDRVLLMIAITIRPAAVTAAVRLIVSGNGCPI